MTRPPVIEIVGDPAALAWRGADIFATSARSAVERAGRFAAALAGGSTPRRMYGLLAGLRDSLPWDRIHLFWGDERHVAPGDPESNFRMAREAFLDAVPIPAENVHRILSERADPEEAAREYEMALRRFFPAGRGDSPGLDLVMLGLGADGHTASLFPCCDRAGIGEDRWVAAVRVESLGAWRITLTPTAINRAASVVFVVSGREKARVVSAILGGGAAASGYPASWIAPSSGNLTWLLDAGAAGDLMREAPGGE